MEKLELYFWGTGITDAGIKEFASKVLAPLSYLKVPIIERATTRTYLKRLIMSLSGTNIGDGCMRELYLRCSDTLN